MAASKLSPAPKKGASRPATVKANRVSISDGPTERSVSIRKIENGYIVSESIYGGKGGYKSKETFTAKPPVVQVEPGGKK